MADVFAGEVGAGGAAITFTEISGSANASPFPDALTDTAAAVVPAVAGATVYPDSTAYPDVPAAIAGNFLFDYYYRIWVLPEVLNAQNPVLDVPIPFAVWNAYPQPAVNPLDAIIATNDAGLSLDFAAGDTWRAIEYKDVNVTIGVTAPLNIAAEYEFDFGAGVGHFYFNATIADFVQMIPDPPVTETWSWLTDVIPSRNNTEQRISLRATPRRTIKYGFLLEDETERRRQYQRWYKSLGSRIVLPFYQYQTRLAQPSALGDSKLWFDPAYTDVRAGEFVIVMNEATVTGYLVKLDTVEADGATTDSPLTFDADAGMIVAPCFTSRLDDRTGLTMKSVTGHLDVAATVLTYRPSFKRPGSTAVIETFDGLPVLHLRPIAAGESPEQFDANYEVVDSETGLEELYISWPHPVVAMTRKWTIRRRQNPAEMDWWRDFLDTVLGMREPFLLPTWFADLTVAEAPTVGSGTLKINGGDYASLYWPYDTFRRLQIETESGIIWRKVLDATANPDGTSTLQLDTTFGGDPADVAISKISYLNRARLASDTVTLTHERLRTQIELATRTVDI
jgi:hypothetical protein